MVCDRLHAQFTLNAESRLFAEGGLRCQRRPLRWLRGRWLMMAVKVMMGGRMWQRVRCVLYDRMIRYRRADRGTVGLQMMVMMATVITGCCCCSVHYGTTGFEYDLATSVVGGIIWR